ncbi:TPA: hypothetical protein N0F65_012078 [Lagenidium giganteum]|uniref:Annexin n=1 Tax=Lagenidium giganteum TaxID=4803 RepID=A0AAV2YMJ9_9STRA|nr:TPA: hypothetical protein N0F65_012078 [Lagenidium giganteum]
MLSIYPASTHDVYKKVKITYSSAIDSACEEIKKACDGIGTDEKALIKVIGSRSPDERTKIALRYKDMFNKDLIDVVRSETSGDFGFLLRLITMPLPQTESYILYKATDGIGTTEQLIYPVMMGRSNEEMSILKKAYFEKYNKDLAVVLNSELSGDFRKVILAALNEPLVEYKSSFHTTAKAEEDAEKLYKVGEGKWGTDEEPFIKILLSSPPQYLELLNKTYNEKYGHGIVKAVEKEFSGYAEKALKFFVRLTLEPWVLLAEHFENTMAGLGTDERSLSAFLVRYHSYLPKVKPVFESTYKISLRERVHGDTNGDYRDLLMNVIDAPTSPTSSY